MKKEKKVKFNLDSDKNNNVNKININASNNQANNVVQNGSLNRDRSNSNIKSIEKKFNKNNMIVAVRVRPLNNKELEFSSMETIKVQNREIITISDNLSYDNDETSAKSGKGKEQKYAFDFAFHKYTAQDEVYECTTKVLLPSVIDGFNATVFAYGASGAGKTYTMVGNGENPGVMVRSVSDLFTMIEEDTSNKSFKIKISYIEIYNETLRDLLREESKQDEVLDMREDPNKGIVLVGIREISVTNPNEVFKLLMYYYLFIYFRKGNKNRREDATIHNEVSSRSHAILQVNLEMKDKVIGLDNEITLGKFILVDLAGSERFSGEQRNTGQRLVESGNINKSLLALANCINGLVDNPGKRNFIPWRDSKLTRLLKVIF